MIPVVRLSRRDLALNGVRDNRNDLVASIVRWILQFHQGGGINSRISITPVCLESSQICFNGLLDEPLCQNGLTRLSRRLPTVLIDPPEDSIRFTTRSPLVDQFEQDPFCILTVAGAI